MLRMAYVLNLCFLCLCLLTHSAYGAINIELTQGVNNARHVAVADFVSEKAGQQIGQDMGAVIRHDLYLTGLFRTPKLVIEPKGYETQVIGSLFQTLLEGATDPRVSSHCRAWKGKGYDYALLGRVIEQTDEKLQVEVLLLDTVNVNKPLLMRRIYRGTPGQWRRIAHEMSNGVYEQLTGKKGAFNSAIAYVVVKRHWRKPDGYALVIAHMDGGDPRVILESSDPIMSPSWSPDGKRLAYVSFEGKRAKIFITELATGKRRLVAHFPGINGAPAWSPDGRHLAVVLSASGVAKIYEMDISTGKIQALTFGSAIDTEPAYSLDGTQLLFTSDRGGGPQIYTLDRNSKQVRRLTFIGRYNASPRFMPQGESILMLHREGALYSIALQDLITGAIKTLSSEGYNDSPSVAPDGSMIVYTSRYQDHSALNLVDLNGRVNERLPTVLGEPQQPAWSPY